MGKYKNLMKNTLVFALGSFSSKLIVLLLTRVFTGILTTTEYGTQQLIVDSSNLILPIMYLCISEAVIRFGLDSTVKKSDVFSVGMLTVATGFSIFLLFMPIMRLIPVINEYVWLLYLYVLASALRTVITNFVRASGFIKLFAIDGLVTTATTVGLTLLFLLKFNMGVTGYVLGTVVADAISAISLFFLLKLYRFLKIKDINKHTARSMLRYCLPIIPSAVFWWITNLSDRYFITYMCGISDSGLYSSAAKVPNMILLVSAIFTQAWQLSAFTEYNTPQGERFYSTVFKSYYTFVFLAASGIILLVKPISSILLAPDYFQAWRYMPFLVLAISFSCFVTFYGSIYNAAKKNTMLTVSSLIGSATNILLNILLIPTLKVQGAAISTFTSFLVVFIIRAIDTRKYIKIDLQPLRMLASLVLLLLQVWIAFSEMKYWIAAEVFVFLLVLLINFGYIIYIAKHFLRMLRTSAKT